jgi:hypothetical protein
MKSKEQRTNEGLRKDVSMSIQEVAPEQLAQLFHHYHQALTADSTGSSDAHPESWEQVPQQEKKRLVSAARLTLLELSTTKKEEGSRRYFAKPGEAEWGC